jgi:hypothetical protein
MAIMVYALVTYHWRASAIRNRGTGPYDDRLGEPFPPLPFSLCPYRFSRPAEPDADTAVGASLPGPTMLSVLLMIAVIVNFVLRYRDD